MPQLNDTINLDFETVVPGGVMCVDYPFKEMDLRAEVQALLVEKGIVDRIRPLDKLHDFLKPEMKEPHPVTTLNKVTESFYDTSPRFEEVYQRVIRHIALNVFDFDFIYQTTPTIRFHFAGKDGSFEYHSAFRSPEGRYLNHHSDSMLGHPFEEINCWLPLTKCYGTNAMVLSNLEDGIKILKPLLEEMGPDPEVYHRTAKNRFYEKLLRDRNYQDFVVSRSKPYAMDYGQLLIFDPRTIHGTDANIESDTRVSLDFRLIPVDKYNQLTREYKSYGRSGRKFARGDVFGTRSSHELWPHRNSRGGSEARI